MSSGRCPRRDGKSQWEAYERQLNKDRTSCAVMRDGSVVQIESLAQQVDLAQSGNVVRFAWMDNEEKRFDEEMDDGEGGF